MLNFHVCQDKTLPRQVSCLVLGVFENAPIAPIGQLWDKHSGGHLKRILRTHPDLHTLGNTLLIAEPIGAEPALLAQSVLLVGCGARTQWRLHLPLVIQTALQTLKALKLPQLLCAFLEHSETLEADLHRMVQAVHQFFYTKNHLKTKSPEMVLQKHLRSFHFLLPAAAPLKPLQTTLLEAVILARSVDYVKSLGDLPPNLCTPGHLVREAKALAREYPTLIKCQVTEEAGLKRLGMGAFLSVAAASHQPPYLITLTYKGGKSRQRPIVFVGKGITYDTGGYSLKPANSMPGMKYDMCGAATVLGVIQAAAALRLPMPIVGIIPTCENMVGGGGSRPDDIVQSFLGKSIEILNTDAEGRLILCDALAYSARFQPAALIDIATLTGACVVALGRHASGLMSHHQPLADALLAAGERAQDRAWQLPLWDEYSKGLESAVADLANIAQAPEAGAVTAGCFLKAFVGDMEWAHLDVAGTAAHYPGVDRGATGRPLPLLIHFLLDRARLA